MKGYFERQDSVFDCHKVVIPLVELAKQQGIHPDKVLKGTRLFYQDMLKKPTQISYLQQVKLIDNAQKLLKRHDCAFLLGRRLFPANLGIIGNALMNCRHIGDMVQLLNRYQAQLLPDIYMQTKRFDDKHFFLFSPAISHESDSHQIFMTELLASAIVNALKWRLGYLPHLTMRFPYPEPQYIEQYQVNLGTNLSFVAHGNGCALQIVIDDSQLYLPFSDGNTPLKRHYLKQLPKRSKAVGLLQYIVQYMTHHQEVTLEQLSDYLELSPATVKRKLAAHNTSFQKVYDGYRRQQAIFDLTTKGQTNEAVAQALHFSDITNFRRSFKRWTGMTPNALKQLFLQ